MCTMYWSTEDAAGIPEPQDDEDSADLSDIEGECDATSAKLRAKKQQVCTYYTQVTGVVKCRYNCGKGKLPEGIFSKQNKML